MTLINKNVAYDLLRKVSKAVYENNHNLQEDYATVHKIDIKQVVENVCESYQNDRNVDKVSMAQSKVKEVTSVMQENVKGMVRNIQDAEVNTSKFKPNL